MKQCTLTLLNGFLLFRCSYSRGIFFWGGPLEDRNQTTNGEENDEVEDSERDKRKE